jgi:hypothetical protein
MRATAYGAKGMGVNRRAAMKRVLSKFVICILTIMLSACAPLENVQTEPSPFPTPNETPVVTPRPSPACTPFPAAPTPTNAWTHAPEPEHLPMFKEYISPVEDTVIIANNHGMIIGGYSDGEWLSHSQAASYCGQPMVFTMKNLDGYENTVEPNGIIMENWPDYWLSRTATMGENIIDYNDLMYLDADLRDYDPANEDCVLYYCPPQRFPVLMEVTDLSPYLHIVQNVLDEEFGAGTVSAQVVDAYAVDIDNDGTAECIINAYNNETYDWDADYTEDYWYSIALIVENNGSVCEIERQCGYGYYDEVDFACVRGVVDVNGDSIFEVISVRRGFEWWLMNVYQYVGYNLSWAFGLYAGN